MSARRQHISTPNAPAAIGPYSQGVLVGDTLYCSGQIALDPETGQLLKADIEDETALALENLGAILKAADMDYRNVVSVTVYMTRLEDYAQVNEVYARYFSAAPPAREAVQVGGIPRGARVEFSCIAVR